ncbi:EAL domain-containing protein [Thiohalobacter sp. IOR34]|uniref:putative bifunctional diguanylate cyclase/phosphodiesterase n=1 Tax=Thiohalobacter sp. IOR34 TaxID=3057176 RepID=UPI0025B12C0C|nr:GGDEF and EAL domain-containing protein [Thiohalobacter sp. IOR34]WJW76558.1 EAL domain-containing protein [Thiohalobacter sp. IOR34]
MTAEQPYSHSLSFSEPSLDCTPVAPQLDAQPAALFRGRLSADGRECRIDWQNAAAAALLGAVEGESLQRWLERVHPADRERLRLGLLRLRREGWLQCDYRLRTDAGPCWIRDQRRLLASEGDGSALMIGSWSDVSDRYRLEGQLQERGRLLQQLMAIQSEGVCVIDLQGRLREINPAGLALLDTDRPVELLGRSPLEFVTEQSRPRLLVSARRVLAGHEARLRIGLCTAGGRVRRVEVRAAPLLDGEGRVASILAVVRDVSKVRAVESRAKYLAHYDTLTGLPNRALFRDRLLQAMAQARRTESLIAVMFLDIDRFKDVNDTLGHAVGDRLLQETASRIASCLRETDVVARFGGDEFGLIQTNLTRVDSAADLAGRIVHAVSQPLRIDGHEIHTGVSIGITLYPFEEQEADDLLRNADMAMYMAKREGRNRYQFYLAELNRIILRRTVIERELRAALEREQMELHYQPQICLQSGRVIGVEALLRWEHPELGKVSPQEFIPVAESSGMIMRIGEWVMARACRQARAWQESGLPPLRVAINLSAVQFRHRGLLDSITRVLEETGADPAMLEVELTESLIMKDVHAAIDVLRHLHDLGVQIAVDDFGTGYSSLSYLTRFPIQKIKLDQSFVRDVGSKDGAAIARTVIMLGHTLGMRVMAEGVENQQQLDFLRLHDCHEAQGYYFSRPMPAAELETLLLEGREGLRALALE